MRKDLSFAVRIAAIVLGLAVHVSAQADADLAKASQNPLGTVINVPFENDTYFGIGPSDATANILNLKPVYPVRIGDINLINRFIIPYFWTEGQNADVPPGGTIDFDPAGRGNIAKGSADGLGDITYTGFLSPADSGPWIWGMGPVLVLPTASEERWASDKWQAGVGVVALSMPGNWVVGMLAQNVWSFAGSDSAADVNSFLFQYFINYNMESGWYLTSTPIITANWESDSDNTWTVPFGGGAGRMVRFGKQPVDFKLAGYWNVEKPENAGDWSLQFQVKFMFPK